MEEQKMNPEVKARWVAALRSGEYRQGLARALNDGNGGFCCLGVLCDLYAKEFGEQWAARKYHKDCVALLGNWAYPPNEVREWAGFHEDHQPVEIGAHKQSVAVHNDGVSVPRRSFAELADAIEDQL